MKLGILLGLMLAAATLAVLVSGCGQTSALGPDELGAIIGGGVDGHVVDDGVPCPSSDRPFCPGQTLYPPCTPAPETIVRCLGKVRGLGISVISCQDRAQGGVFACSTPPAPGAPPLNCWWGCP